MAPPPETAGAAVLASPSARSLVALALLGVLLWPAPSHALGLEPYEARYQAKWRGFSTVLQRRLSKLPDGAWRLDMEGARWFVSYREQSRFALVAPDRLQPLEYRLRIRGAIGKERKEHRHFERERAQNAARGEGVVLEPEDIYDRLSYQEQLRLHLLTGGAPLVNQAVYRVVRRERRRDYRFEFLSRETLQTPLGKLRTLRFASPQRNKEKAPAEVWFAEDWAYLIVRLQEAGEGSLELLSAQVNGRELKGLDAAADADADSG